MVVHNKLKLLVLDLDGTLTQHKCEMDDRCRSILDELAACYQLLILGAGSCERIYKQTGDYPIEIIGYYGMQRSEIINNRFVLAKNQKINVDKEEVSRRIVYLRNELGFKDFTGESVEFHESGVITFPILGTQAPIEKKIAFDPGRSKRRSYHSKVQNIFFDYSVFIGGSSSFDIVPYPYNKLNALEEYIKRKGFSRENVMCFGDDYGVGGNDELLYRSGIPFMRVDDYRSFPDLAENYL